MANLKFVFSNLRCPKANITLPNREKTYVGKYDRVKKNIAEEEETKKKKTPLFYQHKIRVPKYEYF